MLDNEFLEFLEYNICKAYLEAGNKDTKLWCKSVSLSEPEYNYSEEFVSTNKQVTLKAFVGKYGYTEYDLYLKFGTSSSNMFSKKLDMKRCVPNPKNQDVFAIDFERNCISVELL